MRLDASRQIEHEETPWRFDVFYEHQLPTPWNDGDAARLFCEAKSYC